MRKILTFIVLAGLVVAVWYGARWYQHRDDLHATLIFRSADGLRRGNHVVSDGIVLGEVAAVARLESQDAVSVRIRPEHRNRVLTDSLYTIEGSQPQKRITVSGSGAVGRPLADGDIIYAREESLAGWMERQAAKVAPALRDLGARADRWIGENTDFRERLAEWEKRHPDWRKQSDEAIRRNIETLRRETAKLEKELRDAGRKIEADKVRRDFEAWLDRIGKDDAPPADGSTAP
ncbi:MAG: MlaD family protein [Thermoanaerobaculia bacterium]